MAKLTEGSATMRVNDALDDDEVEDGYVLTCQAVPDDDERHGRLRGLSLAAEYSSERGGAGRYSGW